MKDYNFQGKVWLADRLSTGKPNKLVWVDDASVLQIKLATDIEERQESYSGNRLTSVRITKAKKAEFTLTLNAFSKENLALGLYGAVQTVTGGSVVDEVLPASLANNDIVKLDKAGVSALTVKDSAGAPVTVTPANYSLLSAAAGLLQILNIGTYVQPFKASYAYESGVNVAMFTAAAPERYLILDGTNTVDNSRVLVRGYRMRFDPVDQLDLISDSLGSLSLKGALLYDSLNAADANLGGFGRIEMAS